MPHPSDSGVAQLTDDPMYDNHQMCTCGSQCYCGCGYDPDDAKHHWDGTPCEFRGRAMNKYVASDEDWLR